MTKFTLDIERNVKNPPRAAIRNIEIAEIYNSVFDKLPKSTCSLKFATNWTNINFEKIQGFHKLVFILYLVLYGACFMISHFLRDTDDRILSWVDAISRIMVIMIFVVLLVLDLNRIRARVGENTTNLTLVT